MCCKSKWVGGLAALAGLLVAIGVLSGTESGRWLAGTAWVQIEKVWSWGQNQVSPEDELARIANEVENLNKDIAVEFDKIVTQEREVEKVAKDLDKRNKAVAEQWDVITLLKKGIEEAKASEQAFVTFENKKTDISKARQELTERWDAFKRAKNGLELKEAELKEKKNTLEAMNENMSDMVKAKDDYALKVDELKTKLEAARAAQARGDGPTPSDGWKNRQTEIQESMNRIGDQIESMKRHADERAKQVKTKVDTGAAQQVKNDKAEEEIGVYVESQRKLVNK